MFNPYAYKMNTSINISQKPQASFLQQKIIPNIPMKPDPNKNEPKYESVIDKVHAYQKPEDIGKSPYIAAPIHVPNIFIPPKNDSLKKLPIRFTSFASMYSKNNNIPYKKALKSVEVLKLYKEELKKLGYTAVKFKDEDYMYDTLNPKRDKFEIPKIKVPSGLLVSNQKTEPVEPITTNEQKDLERLKTLVKSFEKSITNEYIGLCSNLERDEINAYKRSINNIAPISDNLAAKIFRETEKQYGDILIISPFSEIIENHVVKEYKTKQNKNYIWSPFPASLTPGNRANPLNMPSCRRLLQEFGHKTTITTSRRFLNNATVSTCFIDRKGIYSSYIFDMVTLLLSGMRNLDVYLADTRVFNNIIDMYKVYLSGDNLLNLLRLVRPGLFDKTRTAPENLINEQDIEELKFYLLRQENLKTQTERITSGLSDIKKAVEESDKIKTAVGMPTTDAKPVIKDEDELLKKKAELNKKIDDLTTQSKNENRLYYLINNDTSLYLLSTFYMDKRDNTKIYLLYNRASSRNYLSDGEVYSNEELRRDFINLWPIPGITKSIIDKEKLITEQPKYLKSDDIKVDIENNKVNNQMKNLFAKENTDKSSDIYAAFMERKELETVEQKLNDIIREKVKTPGDEEGDGEGDKDIKGEGLKILGGAVFNNMINLWDELFPISNFEIYDKSGQDIIYKLSFNRIK